MPPYMPKAVFGLPPEDIIEWFGKKGYKISWNWRDLWQDEHVRAFTVAKAMKLDILESIRKELDESMKSGMLFSDFQRRLEIKLKKLGWWGKVKAEDVPGFDPSSGIDPDKEVWLGSPWRLSTIYNANMDTAYSAGRWRGQQQAALTHPYLQYIAVMDDRTRDEHAALDGKVFHIDDKFWDYFYPPNGWNCRCRVRSLTEKQVKQQNLKVEQTGPNNFGFDEFINPDGSMYRIAWYSDKMHKTSPERGWSYNPGKVDWEPNLSKYPKAFTDLFRRDNSELNKQNENPEVTGQNREQSTGQIINLFEKNMGIKPHEVVYNEQLTNQDISDRLNHLTVLFNDYNIPKMYKNNDLRPLKVMFDSTGRSYGWIYPNDTGTELYEVNFGHRFSDARGSWEFDGYRPKSLVDKDNLKISTLYHEFNHLLKLTQQSEKLDRRFASFSKELLKLRRSYRKELLEIQNLAYNEQIDRLDKLYLGEYADMSTNEFMAECFTEYKLRSSPSKYAVLVGELIDKYFKKAE